MPPLIDTHAHLTDQSFADCMDRVLQDARAQGLVKIGVIGFDLLTSQRAIQLATEHPDLLFASVGIQPNSAIDAKPGDWETIEQLAGHESVRAIGETGLDLYWDDTPFDMQRDFFERHIELAKSRDLAMVIHLRETGRQIVDQLMPHAASAALRGVMHSYTGDIDVCRQCLDMGLDISFAGMITFKKSADLRDVARFVPLDRIVVETDSPYLSPEPMRGKRPNEPARVVHTARCIAEHRGDDFDSFARATTANAQRLFGLA